MRKGNALVGMYGVSAVESAAPDRPDLCRPSGKSQESWPRFPDLRLVFQ